MCGYPAHPVVHAKESNGHGVGLGVETELGIGVGTGVTTLILTRFESLHPLLSPPASNTAGSNLPTYSSPGPAAYVFEINAGEVAAHGIAVGDTVRFSGISVEGADC